MHTTEEELIQKFRILQVFLVFSLMKKIVYRHKTEIACKILNS